MSKASYNGTPARDSEAATLWADLEEGDRNYRRMKRNDWLNFKERVYHRRLNAEKIDAAPLIDETIAGYPWREAWFIVQARLFIDDRQNEMMGPEEWYESKRSTGTD